MRKYSFLLTFCFLVCGQQLSVAQTSGLSQKKAADEIPTIILSGAAAYKEKGPDEAIKVWIKGSPIDGSREALSQANNLRQIQDFYGSYQSYDLISIRDVTPKTRILYFVFNFEKGPLFAKFVMFQSEQGWILTTFNFNTKEDAILPSCQQER
jgi:hypothetical protein